MGLILWNRHQYVRQIAPKNLNMTLSKIIFYISLFTWLLPPLKQFRGRFFYYFILQAVSDPIVMILFAFNLHSLQFYLVKDILLLVSLWKPKALIKGLPYFIPLLILVYFGTVAIHYTVICIIIAALHVIVIYLVFKMAIAEVMEFNEVKIFYILISIYELSVILKNINAIITIHSGILYFYLTTAFEILLGLSFIFIREDEKKFAITFKQ